MNIHERNKLLEILILQRWQINEYPSIKSEMGISAHKNGHKLCLDVKVKDKWEAVFITEEPAIIVNNFEKALKVLKDL